MKKIKITFGGLAHSIEAQLKVQGLKSRFANHYQDVANQLINLNLSGILTESELSKARKRLLKKIIKSAELDDSD